ncbi:MAG: tetratricopeptide repeat protein [Moorea sp. SIO4A1]|uniref:tetratricopeptide repeat protein n=1 Tax=Moorena sp. SIO4A1 TaxID=2607835 RepID=UPI00144D5C44|nr:tetratricopeptide repeat protein [Moorena sp. SIO4A1]NEQ62775.1 tetratricopeptide repeat protein [Moorena sp. SIO4A1]
MCLLLGFRFASPLISKAYNDRGNKNHNQGKLGIAEENYKRAIELNPDNVDAHHNLSNLYNDHGKKNHDQGKLSIAEENYKRAIELNPDNFDSHYNLGDLYEDLQQFDKAGEYYRSAVKGNVPEASNNLARLFIKNKEYSEAVTLLYQGLQQANQQDSFPEINYNLFKNLGWARFQQGRDPEAEQVLNIAIGIASKPEVAQYLWNRGSAHCLLAQVLERQKKPGAIQQWQQCSKLGSTGNPDEDTWLDLAHKTLSKARQSWEEP